MANKLLHGVFDMHVHSAPDFAPRKADDIELAQTAAEAGMGGLVLKAHQGSTVERAYLVQKVVPNIRVFGGVVLNYPIGGLNPHAVDLYVRMGAKEVWMPTLSADSHISFQKTKISAEQREAFRRVHGGSHILPKGLAQPGDFWPWTKKGQGISVLDDSGKLLPEVFNILEVIAPSDAILSTGHLSIPETLALIQSAQEMGVKRLLITHPEYQSPMSIEDQKALARKNVFFERCFVCTTENSKFVGGGLQFEVIAKNIRSVGVESTVLGTDFGQAMNKHPVMAMMDYLHELEAAGFSEVEIERMAVKTPSALLSI